ncbi:MAG: Os1348 family NHLP clan protein [Caldilineales bacterium]|nr:Os1348 family NHLP clan protein [Caldilineales bacterium]MCW5859332.1 hypothetical protein [Caldilineales bacterium]
MPMSINRKSKTVADILGRAATDPAFRTLLLTNPAAALAGYSLTDEERAALSDRETVLSLLQ